MNEQLNDQELLENYRGADSQAAFRTPLIKAIAGSASPNMIEFLLFAGQPLDSPEAAPARQPLDPAVARGDEKITEMIRTMLKPQSPAAHIGPAFRKVPEYVHSSFTRAAELGGLAALESKGPKR